MSAPMNSDEKDIAEGIVDYLTAGGDIIATGAGTISMHTKRGAWASSNEMLVSVDGVFGTKGMGEQYEVVVTVRRKR